MVLLAWVAGSVTTTPAAFNTGQKTYNSGRPYINGNREQATSYLLDGLENVEFVDNNFFVAEKRTLEIAAGLRGGGIAWWAEARPDTLMMYSDATWRAMRESRGDPYEQSLILRSAGRFSQINTQS